MIVTIVQIYVKPDQIAAFKAATMENHNNSIKEPANIRFDILQSHDDPGEFAFYEVFENKAGIEAHKKTEHYKTWRETVEPMMAQPRKGKPFFAIAPEDEAKWKS